MRKILTSGVGRLLFGLAVARRLRVKKPDLAGLFVNDLGRKVGVDEVTRRYLLYFLMPLWIVTGLLDWYNHRRTKIEQTAGTHESLTHILAMSEVGLPIMMGLFLDVNAQVLLMMIAGFLAVIVALIAKGWIYALITLGLIIAVQQLEGHVLQPLVMGRAVSIHPLAIVLAIAGGGVLAGIVGALLAVPTVAFLNNAMQVLLAPDPSAEAEKQTEDADDTALVKAKSDSPEKGPD